MGTTTGIKWTDHTFSPWWGCVRVSAGCQNCYAESMAKRVGDDVWGKGKPRRAIGPKTWNDPLRWDREVAAGGTERRTFSASMCDVFEDHTGPMVDHLGNPLPGRSVAEERERLFRLITDTPHLRWQLLTKRPENVAGMVPVEWMRGEWPANAAIGTTVEDQAAAELRVPILLTLPAPMRFLSCEPLLGMVALHPGWLAPAAMVCGRGVPSHGPGRMATLEVLKDAGRALGWKGVDWVICGGESGPGFRPMDLDHARRLRAQCAHYGVPFFFKQDSGLRSGTPGPADLAGQQFPEGW